MLSFPDGQPLRGDSILSVTLRNDLAPVPCTLEAEILAGDENIEKRLAEGERLITSLGDAFRIVKSVKAVGKTVSGERVQCGFRVTAILDAVFPIALTRSRAIIKENATLGTLYRLSGARFKGLEGDFPVPRFCCPVGETPTFHFARILQEEGGVVRWKNGKLKFFNLLDLARQKPIKTIKGFSSDTVETGFLERHSVPWFLSVDPSGTVIFGNQKKARAVRFSPFKNGQRLRNMTRCLVRKKVIKLTFDARISAGDCIDTVTGEKFIVMTAAHVIETGSDSGGRQNSYSRLWLGQVEE